MPEPDDAGAAHDDDQAAPLRREAATWRHRLRQAEAGRDELASNLRTLRQAEVERALAEHLADPSDLLRDVDPDRFYVEGRLDPEAVKREAEAAIAAHPHWRRQPVPDFGAGARHPPPEDHPRFGRAIKEAATG